jgi:hypothetical protein
MLSAIEAGPVFSALVCMVLLVFPLPGHKLLESRDHVCFLALSPASPRIDQMPISLNQGGSHISGFLSFPGSIPGFSAYFRNVVGPPISLLAWYGYRHRKRISSLKGPYRPSSSCVSAPCSIPAECFLPLAVTVDKSYLALNLSMALGSPPLSLVRLHPALAHFAF